MRNHALATAAVLIASAGSLVLATQAAAATTGSCTFKKTEFSASTDEQTTTSATFTDLGDGGSITFTQSRTGCVAGEFYGNAGNSNGSDNVVLQVLLDGNTCSPLTGGYVFANGGVDLSSHAVGFLCGTSVAAGSHTVQVQWAAGIGGAAAIFQHTLEVSHK